MLERVGFKPGQRWKTNLTTNASIFLYLVSKDRNSSQNQTPYSIEFSNLNTFQRRISWSQTLATTHTILGGVYGMLFLCWHSVTAEKLAWGQLLDVKPTTPPYADLQGLTVAKLFDPNSNTSITIWLSTFLTWKMPQLFWKFPYNRETVLNTDHMAFTLSMVFTTWNLLTIVLYGFSDAY